MYKLQTGLSVMVNSISKIKGVAMEGGRIPGVLKFGVGRDVLPQNLKVDS